MTILFSVNNFNEILITIIEIIDYIQKIEAILRMNSIIFKIYNKILHKRFSKEFNCFHKI